MKSLEQCGYIAIIGRPNVGKSTLLNHLIGKKISIISAKPQTTRNQILGIKTVGSVQAIYMDTPGIHAAEKRAMNRYMNRLATSVIPDADIIIFMTEELQWTPEDEFVLKKLKSAHAQVTWVINKVDLIKNKDQLLPFIEQIKEKFHFHDILPLSARRPKYIESLEKIIFNLLPSKPHLFPKEQVTDKNENFQAAELIREKIIKATGQEVPYSTAVMVESIKMIKKIKHINAIIFVEREGQKPIVIGKNGGRLKTIGTLARKEMEQLFKQKVFLRLWVKVKNNWMDDDKALQEIGIV